MTQVVVSRLAGSGASIKNYCLALCTAICGLSVALQKPAVFLLALLPIILFSALDAQYLRNERRFRSHFDKIRSEDWAVQTTFDMSPAPSASFWSAFFSWSVITFYGALVGSIIGLTIIMRLAHGRFV
ncbi:hypothetical protein [Bosea sp. CRIB-10]|uniref:hypothetical protein n=1 Tax=Bosea sp. CRIB-10 TaxID=378404 RepID=UPI0011136764|nr:hypothetical protein [Bosea sp. CRIB-10]